MIFFTLYSNNPSKPQVQQLVQHLKQNGNAVHLRTLEHLKQKPVANVRPVLSTLPTLSPN